MISRQIDEFHVLEMPLSYHTSQILRLTSALTLRSCKGKLFATLYDIYLEKKRGVRQNTQNTLFKIAANKYYEVSRRYVTSAAGIHSRGMDISCKFLKTHFYTIYTYLAAKQFLGSLITLDDS